jgi:phosphoglycerate-specific signal transduction histidine kinase
MALRSNDKSLGKTPGKILGKSRGRIWVPGFLRPQWGVRGSLFAAFAVIAGMAIIISAVAAMVLGRLGGNMVDLTGRDIPRLAASLQLAAQSASLAGQGPALLASQSEEVLNERAKKMKETQEVTLQKLGEIIELGADKTVVAVLSETVKNTDDTINSLGAAARERLAAAAEHEKLYDTLRSAQTNFGAVAHPAMTDAQARIRATLGSANPALDEAAQAAQEAQEVDQLGTVIAGGNLMAFEMTAALSANSSDALEAIGKEFKITQQRVKSNLDLLAKIPTTRRLETRR